MVLSAVATLSRLSVSASSYSSSLLKRNHIRIRIICTVSSKRQQQHSCSRTMASSTQVAAAAKQDKVTAPYGSWKSPITADVVSGSSKRLGGTAVDAHGRLYWLESRPTEAGYVYVCICHILCIKIEIGFW